VGKWLAGRALPSQDKIRALSLWLEVSPHWLRFGDAEGKSSPVLRQTTASYRVDPQWPAKKYEALNEQHDLFDLCEAALSVGIALLGITALTKKWPLLYVAVIFVIAGAFFGAAGFMNLPIHPEHLASWLT
jgi:hypothetical protein